MQINNTEITKNKFQAAGVPLFLEAKTGDKMVNKADNSQIAHEISLFDVKELYDLAYSKPSDSEAFKTIMAEAVKMDMAYRRQLIENTAYKGPFGTYKEDKPAKSSTKAVDAA